MKDTWQIFGERFLLIIGLIFIYFIVCEFLFRELKGNVKRKFQLTFDRVISESFKGQILGLITFVTLIFFLLLFGSWFFHPFYNKMFSLNGWDIASHFLNPGNFKIDGDHTSKVWAMITGLAGMVFLSGLCISVLSNMFERRVDKVKKGKVSYKMKDHYVIIGYDRMTISLIKQLDRRKDKRYILLQTIQDVPGVRHELFSHLERSIERRVVIVSGNRNLKEDLQNLHIDRCKELFLLGENEEYDHDSVSIECLNKVYEILGKKPEEPLRCNVLFEYQSTFAVFQVQDLDAIKDRIEFVAFNFYETWARKVFARNFYTAYDQSGESIIHYNKLDWKPITKDSVHYVHLVVIGMTRMGVAMGVQAAHMCHFPNFETKGLKTRITFIDQCADQEMNFLLGRYRHFFREIDYFYQDLSVDQEGPRQMNIEKTFTDIQFEFIKARVEDPAVQKMLADWSDEKDKLLTIAVCFNYAPMAIATGLYLPDEVYTNRIPVLIRQETSYCTLAMLFKKEEDKKEEEDGEEKRFYRYEQVRPFGMVDNCIDLEPEGDLLPMMIDYVYSYYYDNRKKGAFPVSDEQELALVKEVLTPMDLDQITVSQTDGKIIIPGKEKGLKEIWNKLTIAKKWSNRYNADTVKLKFRSLGREGDSVYNELTDEETVILAKTEHNRWNIEKLLMGFRPSTPQEDLEIEEDLKREDRNPEEPDQKDRYKAKLIHYDIKPYRQLRKDGNNTNAREYDLCISSILPRLIRRYKELKQQL